MALRSVIVEATAKQTSTVSTPYLTYSTAILLNCFVPLFFFDEIVYIYAWLR